MLQQRCVRRTWTRWCWSGAARASRESKNSLGNREMLLIFRIQDAYIHAITYIYRAFFGKDVNDEIDPDLTVAYGAASILD